MTSIWFPNNKYPPNTKNYLPCFVLGGGFSIRRKGLVIFHSYVSLQEGIVPHYKRSFWDPPNSQTTSAHLRLVRVRTNSHHTRKTGADRWQELNLSAMGVPR